MARTGSAQFAICRNADADAFAVGARLGLLLAQTGVIHLCQGLAQRSGVVAAVIDEAGGRRIGKIAGADEVLEADLGRVHFQFGGQDIDHALDAVRGFGPARSAIGVGGHAVGEYSDHVGQDVFEVVEPRHHQHRKCGDGGREKLVIRADILDELELQTEHGSIALGGQLEIVHVAAAVYGGLEVFAARLDPLHGFAEAHGHEAHQRLFRIHLKFGAKATADLGRNHAQMMLPNPEDSGHQAAQQVGDLGRGIEGEGPLAGTPVGHDAACLHRRGDQALADDALFHHDIGVAERLCDVAAILVIRERDVVGPLGMNGGSAGRERLLGVGDGAQRLVFDLDGIGGVAREIAVGGHYDGDRVAAEIDAILRQQVMVRHAQSGQGGAAGHGTQILDIGAGEDRGDTGHGGRGFGIDALDLGRAVRAAHDARVVHAGHLEIVNVSGGAGDEARVLLAAHALAE